MLHHRHCRRGDASGRDRAVPDPIGDITRTLMDDYSTLVRHAKAEPAKVAAVG